MDDPDARTSQPLQYASPGVAARRVWTATDRLRLAVIASVLHFGFGFAVLATFNAPKFASAVEPAWLFPFGLVALWVNPHELLTAAIGNSIFCGFVFAYLYAFWRSRRRNV
jgi:hypothetical protein